MMRKLLVYATLVSALACLSVAVFWPEWRDSLRADGSYLIPVAVDIKPGSCPNPVNVKANGVIPVAVLGTGDFDVTDIDIASIRLVGIPPLRSSFEDVATPFEPYLGKDDPYACDELGSDGFEDLTLKFDQQELARALGNVEDGDVLVLPLMGELHNGFLIGGEDVVLIIKKNKKK